MCLFQSKHSYSRLVFLELLALRIKLLYFYSYSMAQGVIAAFFIFAVVIVAFNLLVVVTVYTVGKYRSMAEHIKASLAIANGIVGKYDL